MAETKKITKREVIEMMLKEDFIMNNENYFNYLSNELELIKRKASSNSNSRKDDELNNTILEMLIKELETCENGATISQLLAKDAVKNFTYKVKDEDKFLSNQKITSIFKKELEKGESSRIAKSKNKKDTIFTICK